MTIRNASYNQYGTIDCEINHPQHGWIPFTASPDGPELNERLVFDAVKDTAAPYEPDPEEELRVARAAKIAEINAMYVETVTPLIEAYPQIERDTWWAQEPEATAYLEWEEFGGDTDPPPTPVLDNILLGRNGEDGTETLHDLSLAVLDNAQRFTEAQQLTGRRQRLVKLARAAETLEVLDAISW